MTNKNVKRISMILAALMVAGAATGCGAKKDTKVESTNKVATHSAKLDENAIKDTYTGIDDMYVLEGSRDVDYLDGVLYDSSIVKGIDVDSSKVDASKTGDYKITFSITADRTAYDAFRDAFIKSETAKDKPSADKAKTDKESTDKTKTDKKSADKTKTETVKVKKDTVVVNRDEAQKLADQNKLVRTDNGETVKKSDGTEVKTEQKAPASTAVTGGNVVDASAKTEVKPEITAAPAMSPEEAKKEEAKKDDKKEETKKPSTSGNTNKPNNGSSSNNKPSSKPNSGSNKQNNGSGSNSKPSSKPNSGSNKPNNGNSSNSKPSHTHTWVNVTKTVNHPAVTHQEDVYENRQVKVKDAWDEKVYVKTEQICRQCRTSNPDEMDEHMLENGHSCHSQDIYKTVHHDAVYETQRVKTGTKTVVDKAAWTETVVIGQKCSSCGKRK